MLHLYHEFARSIRTGDIDLYIYCLPRITNYFFCLNHPNYAKWLVLFHDNLLKLNETHPEVHKEFKKGCFSLKRTKKPFSRLPIDLTLEQTINADAESQRHGIEAITNSISARQKWAQSHFLRTSVISSVFEDLGMTSKKDITQDLKPNRIKKNSADLAKMVSMIEGTMNPFSESLDKTHMYNIGSGKAALPQTRDFLLNVVNIACKSRETFIDECSQNPKRFDDRSITRQKLLNFASEGGKYKVNGVNKKSETSKHGS